MSAECPFCDASLKVTDPSGFAVINNGDVSRDINLKGECQGCNKTFTLTYALTCCDVVPQKADPLTKD